MIDTDDVVLKDMITLKIQSYSKLIIVMWSKQFIFILSSERGTKRKIEVLIEQNRELTEQNHLLWERLHSLEEKVDNMCKRRTPSKAINVPPHIRVNICLVGLSIKSRKIVSAKLFIKRKTLSESF